MVFWCYGFVVLWFFRKETWIINNCFHRNEMMVLWCFGVVVLTKGTWIIANYSHRNEWWCFGILSSFPGGGK